MRTIGLAVYIAIRVVPKYLQRRIYELRSWPRIHQAQKAIQPNPAIFAASMGGIYLNSGAVLVDPARLISWFDSWVDEMAWRNIVDGESVVRRIAGQVSRHTHDIGTTMIRNTFRQLLVHFEPNHVGSREEGVHSDLHTLLLHDVQMGHSLGTKKTRQTFYILACVARIIESERLAEAITRFLRQHVSHVVGKEKPERYGEWVAALKELRGLEDDAILDQLTACFLRWSPISTYNWPVPTFYDDRRAAKMLQHMLESFDPSDYRRGRRDKQLRPYSWPVRARSAPAYGYDRCIPDMRAGFQVPVPVPISIHRHRYLQPVSPRMPLPLPLPAIEYADDYDDLRAEQDAQAEEVEDLRQRVLRLEWED